MSTNTASTAVTNCQIKNLHSIQACRTLNSSNYAANGLLNGSMNSKYTSKIINSDKKLNENLLAVPANLSPINYTKTTANSSTSNCVHRNFLIDSIASRDTGKDLYRSAYRSFKIDNQSNSQTNHIDFNQSESKYTESNHRQSNRLESNLDKMLTVKVRMQNDFVSSENNEKLSKNFKKEAFNEKISKNFQADKANDRFLKKNLQGQNDEAEKIGIQSSKLNRIVLNNTLKQCNEFEENALEKSVNSLESTIKKNNLLPAVSSNFDSKLIKSDRLIENHELSIGQFVSINQQANRFNQSDFKTATKNELKHQQKGDEISNSKNHLFNEINSKLRTNQLIKHQNRKNFKRSVSDLSNLILRKRIDDDDKKINLDFNYLKQNQINALGKLNDSSFRNLFKINFLVFVFSFS